MNTRLNPTALLPTLADIEAAAQVVYRDFAATPQYRWGLLSERLGTDCWLKHENHTPVGAFKIRGGLTYNSHTLACAAAVAARAMAPGISPARQWTRPRLYL